MGEVVSWALVGLRGPERRNPPEIDAVVAQTTYYHGTSTEAQGAFTLENGIVPRQGKQSRKQMAPVAGRVYLSPQIELACIHALGGVWMGTAAPDYLLDVGRYGYLFVVPGASLLGADIQPDEDSVGEMAAQVLREPLEARDAGGWRRRLLDLSTGYLTINQIRQVKDGVYAYWAQAGKKLVKHLSVAEKASLLRAGAHLAVAGSVRPTQAWRIDKSRSIEIKKDASNFFQVAERIQ